MPSTAPPTYPALIARDDHGGAPLTALRYTNWDSVRASNYFGPYSVGTTTLYFVTLYQPTSLSAWVTVFKSTDSGLTWAEMDPANRKPITRPVFYGSYNPVGVFRSGNDLYVSHSEDITIDLFSFSSDTWQSTVASGGPTCDDCRPVPMLQTESRHYPCVLSDGSVVVFYQSPPETVSGSDWARVQVTIWDPGLAAWSSPTAILPGGDFYHQGAIAAVKDAADRVHFFTLANDWDDAFGRTFLHIYHVCWDGAAFSSPVLVNGIWEVEHNSVSVFGPAQLDYNHVGLPAYVPSGDLLAVPFLGKSAGVSKLVIATATAAATPTWTQEFAAGTTAAVGSASYYPTAYAAGPKGNSLMAYDDGASAHLAWSVGGSATVFAAAAAFAVESRRVAPGSWSAPEEVYQPYYLRSIYGHSTGWVFSTYDPDWFENLILYMRLQPPVIPPPRGNWSYLGRGLGGIGTRADGGYSILA